MNHELVTTAKEPFLADLLTFGRPSNLPPPEINPVLKPCGSSVVTSWESELEMSWQSQCLVQCVGVMGVLVSVPQVSRADAFREKVVPFVKAYCVECHDAKKKEAQLDLSKYATAEMVAADYRQWEHVLTFVTREEMPPPDAKQPVPAERAEVLKVLEALLLTEARRTAGDPGVILPRRLSNAEYNNAIRDLTGVDIRPADAFPVDPASGEGFSNTGEALVMSPNLFKKYYAAAQHVADHVLLTPTQMSFAPHPVVTFADQKKLTEQAILAFYARHAVDYSKYFAAAWSFRDRPADRKTASIEEWARERHLSTKYLRSLWDVLDDKQSTDRFYLNWLRQRWNALPALKESQPSLSNEEAAAIRALADDIKKLSQRLCMPETEAIVSNAGNGPVQHINRRQKTAANRDVFDPAVVGDASRRLHVVLNLPQGDEPMPLIKPTDPMAKDVAASGGAFCRLFPNRFFFADDTRGLSAGFHLIEGFFRDDQPLCKLVLNDEQNRELDRLWDELSFVTGIPEKMLRGFVFFERSERNFMKHPDFDSIKEEDPELTSEATMLRFEQIYLKRSGVKDQPIAKWVDSINAGRPDDIPDEIKTHAVHDFFDGIRQSLKRRAAQWPAAAPIYQQRLLEFANAAYRRPLTNAERQKLTAFFTEASQPEALGIEQAVRATVTRILVSPHFCYLADAVPSGTTTKPLPDLALASRLSFFLWSSIPDAELRTLAESGKLNSPETLRAQTQRMLRDPKVRGFSLEFFGQWLNYKDFKQTEAVNRAAFPAFDDALRDAMFEEPTRLASHVLQHNLPLTDLLRSDTTFVNKRLAQHYGLPFDHSGNDWQLATGLHQQGRSGLLGMAVFLTKNSQPQRTSPVKRGFWVVHKLLGEHIPPPPPDVAVLPAKETDTNGQTIRELLARHTEDNKCARCHVRFDPIGLAMEGFDSIGRARSKDLAGRAIDNAVKLPSGEQARGVAEFSRDLAESRHREFTRTLSRKLLGYALGRSLQLSDLVLLEQMESTLHNNGNRALPLFEAITTSPAFRSQRCREFDLSAFEKSVETARSVSE